MGQITNSTLVGAGISPVVTLNAPLTIGSGLKGWWDATVKSSLWQNSTRTTPVTSDADPVGCIDDLSGNGKNMVQATAGARPLYKTGLQAGCPALFFQGTDDVLATASVCQTTSVATMFCVVKSTVNGGKFFINGAAAGSNGYGFNKNGANRDFLCEGVANQTGAAMGSGFEIWVGTISAGPAWVLRINGSAITINPSNSTVSAPTLQTSLGGTTSFLTGHIIEAGIYDNALSGPNLGKLETYLNLKYAIF